MSEVTLHFTILGACDASLAAADLTLRDQAAAALVRHYARLIDHAASLATEAEIIWGELDLEDITARKHLAKLEAAVSAQAVASDLGPKLLAGLTALGCTLAGRGVKGTESAGAADPKRAAHDQLAARRAARKHDTAVGDASAR